MIKACERQSCWSRVESWIKSIPMFLSDDCIIDDDDQACKSQSCWSRMESWMKSIPMFLSADWIIDDDDKILQESELLIKSGVLNEVYSYVPLSLLDNRWRRSLHAMVRFVDKDWSYEWSSLLCSSQTICIIDENDQGMQWSELLIKSGLINEIHYYVPLSWLDNRWRR